MAIDHARRARRIEAAYVQNLVSGDTLEVGVEERPTGLLVTLTGSLDMTSAPLLTRNLRRIERGAEVVVLDAAGLRFVDTAGLTALVAAHRRAAANSRRLVITGAGPALLTPLHAAGLEGALPLAPDGSAPPV